MGISIAIATYNRAQELERTLDSLERVDRTGVDDFEVLIIDNNSTDQTADIAATHSHRSSGQLRHLLETKQGLSHARNRAIAEARHSIVAFVDDDVDFDENWLLRLSMAFADGSHAAVGGRASLVYPSTRPKWLGDREEGLLTKVELGTERRPAAPDEIFGLNLAIRKEWLVRVGGFRTDLGRVGTCLLSGEESELLGRIAAAGGSLLYDPGVLVWHRVPLERLRRRWFLSRSYWGHRGEIRILSEDQVSAYEAGRRAWHVALAFKDLARASLLHHPCGEECFHKARVFSGRLGSLVGMTYRLATNSRTNGRHLPSILKS